MPDAAFFFFCLSLDLTERSSSVDSDGAKKKKNALPCAVARNVEIYFAFSSVEMSPSTLSHLHFTFQITRSFPICSECLFPALTLDSKTKKKSLRTPVFVVGNAQRLRER